MFAIKVLLVFLASIFLNFVNCENKKYESYKNQVGINLVFSYPIIQVVDNKTFFYKLIDTIPIVYYKNYRLYHLPKARILETEDKVPNDNTYFLYQKDSSYGVEFKTTNKKFNNIIVVDSFLKERAFAGAILQNGPNDTLVEIIKSENGNLLEKYVPKENNNNYFDSLFFYYTNDLKSIDFSFSKKMDSLKMMKFFKVRLINNEGFSNQYNALLPKREYLFEINQISKDSLKKYINIIKVQNSKTK